MFLEKELKELAALFEHFERQSSTISEKAVGWHIEHSLKSVIVICDALEQSDPAAYKRTFNMARFFVYTTGSIPRGKGKSPKVVQPAGTIKKENLVAQLKTAKSKLEMLNTLHRKSNFPHPYFGLLNLKQGKRFIQIHTRHHLKIIRDIMDTGKRD